MNDNQKYKEIHRALHTYYQKTSPLSLATFTKLVKGLECWRPLSALEQEWGQKVEHRYVLLVIEGFDRMTKKVNLVYLDHAYVQLSSRIYSFPNQNLQYLTCSVMCY